MTHYGKDNPHTGSEDNLQRATCNLLKIKYPALWAIAFHVPNGGNRPTRTNRRTGKTYSPAGKKLKDMGAKAGVPDWLILQPFGNWHGIAIELKTKGGSVQPTQKAFLQRLDENGYFTAVCWSVDGFLEALEEFYTS